MLRLVARMSGVCGRLSQMVWYDEGQRKEAGQDDVRGKAECACSKREGTQSGGAGRKHWAYPGRRFRVGNRELPCLMRQSSCPVPGCFMCRWSGCWTRVKLGRTGPIPLPKLPRRRNLRLKGTGSGTCPGGIVTGVGVLGMVVMGILSSDYPVDADGISGRRVVDPGLYRGDRLFKRVRC